MDIEAQMNDIQRSLGRIEGKQEETLNALQVIREDLATHKQDDQRNFSSIRLMINNMSQNREKHLTTQDEKLASLQSDSDRAKGARYAIAGLLGVLVTAVSGLITAILSGKITIRFHP